MFFQIIGTLASYAPATYTPTAAVTDDNDDGLTTAAKVGIGLGAVFVFMLLLIVLCCCACIPKPENGWLKFPKKASVVPSKV